MRRTQLKLDQMWSSRKVSSDRFSPSTDELEILSLPESSLHEALASPSEQSTSAISIVNGNLDDESSNRVPDHDYSSSLISHIDRVQEISASKRPKHRTQFLPGWEKRPEAQYKTYVFDGFGARHEQLSCWLSVSSDGNSMRCKLCTKRAKGTNANGKENIWRTTGMKTFSLDKIKIHQKSLAHKEAEQQELLVSSQAQPDWHLTQHKELNKHQIAIQNLMRACVFLCQQDISLNAFPSLCILLETSGVTLLPAETSGVSYRNKEAALCFTQHIASYLHEELLEKVKASPVVGWTTDDSTSRSTDKSCIVYVRYVENFEAKTSYYGLLDFNGDGTAKNILKSLTCLWKKDDLNSKNSCWLATDNASSLTGVNENLSVLFDPQHLIRHKQEIDSNEYGRSALASLRKKYKDLKGFDSTAVIIEWESLKRELSDFTNSLRTGQSMACFWKDFILFKQSINSLFNDEFKNILVLLDVYLVSPTNSAECERGVIHASAVNRIQTTERSRLLISTLDVLLTVRMLLTDDLRSDQCQKVLDKAFDSWNNQAYNRRLYQIQLMDDVPDNYEPKKQARSVAPKTVSAIETTVAHGKAKKWKTRAISCANGCRTEISVEDAIQCCHQHEALAWIYKEDNCSRWLCNGCRIQLSIKRDSTWYCSDHVNMHLDDDSDENEED